MPTDEALVSAYLSGQESALEQLIARHLDTTYAYALRLTSQEGDAQDIAQDAFLKAWKNLKHFDARKSRFKTWLMHIVRNTTIDSLRRKKSIPLSSFEDAAGVNALAENIEDTEPLPEEVVAMKDDKKALEEALAALSPAHREVLLLYHQNDFSFEEMAHITGESRNTLKSRYRRALQALREILQKSN